MILDVKIDGLEEVKKHFKRISNQIEESMQDVVREVANLGWEHALSLAPEYSGNLKMGIVAFQETPESWLVVSGQGPKGWTPNIAFDEGDFSNMTMFGPGGSRVPFVPRDVNTIGFMKNTAEMIEQEFAERLNIRIERIVK